MTRRRKRKRKHATNAEEAREEAGPSKKARVMIKEPDNDETPKKKSRKRRRRSSKLEKSPNKKKKKIEKSPRKWKKGEKPKRRKKFWKKGVAEIKHRKRRRMNYMRMQLASLLEKALVEAPGIPLIYHLFTERDHDWVPMARLQEVLSQLRISQFVKKVHFMTENYWMSLSNYTRLFAIEREGNGQLYLKYWPIYDKKASTVYVDKLPDDCNEEKLMRLAKCFGNVAHLNIAKKPPRWIRPYYIPKRKRDSSRALPKKIPEKYQLKNQKKQKKRPLIDVGSRPRSFGFIRFVDRESAENMVKKYLMNDPSIPYERHDAQLDARRAAIEQEILENGPDPENMVHFERHYYFYRRPFCELAMTRLLREIEFLKKRRRRRPWPMYRRLFLMRRKLRWLRGKEFACKVRAGLCPRPAWMRRKSYSRRMYERHLHEARLRREAEEEQARLDAIAEEQERLDLLSMQAPEQQPSNSSAPVVPVRPNAPMKDLSLIAPPEVKRRMEREKRKKEREAKKKNRKCKICLRKRKNKKRRKWKYFYDENGKFLKRKRRRKRRKMSRKAKGYIFGGVRRFFRDIQVLSLEKYLKLKAEWIGLQKQVDVEIQKVIDAHEARLPDLDL